MQRKRKSKRTQPYKYGVPKKYTAGSKDPKKKAAEIKKTAAAYKAGKKINVKAVERSRVAQGKKKKARRK